jgi:hypothetical protein
MMFEGQNPLSGRPFGVNRVNFLGYFILHSILGTVMIARLAFLGLLAFESGMASAKDEPPFQIDLERVSGLSLPSPLMKGRGSFVSAASGLAQRNGVIYIVSDDENALFVQRKGQPLGSFALTNVQLPADAKERKDTKPDFESLVLLSNKEWEPNGALVVWPSASDLHRMTAYVVPFGKDDMLQKSIAVNILPLAYKFATEAGDVNIEGIFVRDKDVFFLQRGEPKDGKNGIFKLAVKDWLNGLRTGDWMKAKEKFDKIKMGALNGVDLTLADATWTSQGLLALASAEDKKSSFADGHVMGTALVRLVGNKAQTIGVFPPNVKLEGILLEKEEGDNLHFLLVEDADDHKKASVLYRAIVSAADIQKVK